MATTTQHNESQHPVGTQPRRGGHIGLIVAGSLAAGLIVALALIAAPFTAPRREGLLPGLVLLAFSLGWALLAVLSVRFSDQPQRWAAAPAVFMGVAAAITLSGSHTVQAVFSWVWPPLLLGLVVWIVIRSRVQLRSWTRRWLLYPVLLTMALASIGGGYETVAAATAAVPPMQGQLIDVGGRRLHIACTGTGGPTVVLEAGGGEASSAMGWIAPAVARDTRVCVYDRAGRGWSDRAEGPLDGAQTAADLHTLLVRANVPGPYVLAGHSFGGLYVLAFAASYPDDVAGLVLLDSTLPKPGPAATTTPGSYDALGRVTAVVGPAIANFGAARLFAQLQYGSMPPTSRDEARADSASPYALVSTADEYGAANTAMRQAAAPTHLADKPLIVVTAARQSSAGWLPAQDKLAKLSTNSEHVVLENATHDSLVSDKTDAAAATQAIRDVVAAVATSQPLTAP